MIPNKSAPAAPYIPMTAAFNAAANRPNKAVLLPTFYNKPVKTVTIPPDLSAKAVVGRQYEFGSVPLQLIYK